MITHVRFQNFKALKNAELKLGAFNVIIGPNGSGKSSVLQGLEAMGNPGPVNWKQTVTAGMPAIELSINLDLKLESRHTKATLNTIPQDQNPLAVFDAKFPAPSNSSPPASHVQPSILVFDKAGRVASFSNDEVADTVAFLNGVKTFSFQAALMPNRVDARNWKSLKPDGSNLAGALTYLRDKDEDAYDRLRLELNRWIPEYDGIGFENDENGCRTLNLRQKFSRQQIPASQLSEGTLLALALLTVAHQPDVPTLIGLEEPDRGLHPRLLRELRDALYRLSFPADFGINRPPIQVVITTHSPLFLDLFKEHPEQVIIAEKSADGSATFKNLSDDAQLREIIGDAPLGEVWYSGILGGVPVAA